MSSVDKVSNILGDRKEEVVTTPLLDNKSSKKDVDKDTGELENMKEAVITIRTKGLYKFEDQFKGYAGWFKLESVVFKTKFSTIHSEF